MKPRALPWIALLAVALAPFFIPARAAAEEPQITRITVTREAVDGYSFRWRYTIHIRGFNFSRLAEVEIDGKTGPAEGEEQWKIERETIGIFGITAFHITLPTVDHGETLDEGHARPTEKTHQIVVTNHYSGADGERDPSLSRSTSATAKW